MAGLLALMPGCLTYKSLEAASRVKATAHLRPVMLAIEDYKKETGRTPASLDDVQARQKKPFPLKEMTESGLVWSIHYRRDDDRHYMVSYHHVFCDLTYVDGKFHRWNYNPFH